MPRTEVGFMDPKSSALQYDSYKTPRYGVHGTKRDRRASFPIISALGEPLKHYTSRNNHHLYN